MFDHIEKTSIEVRQKTHHFASYFQLSSRCLEFTQTRTFVFDIHVLHATPEFYCNVNVRDVGWFQP